jgi:hypothetical protein
MRQMAVTERGGKASNREELFSFQPSAMVSSQENGFIMDTSVAHEIRMSLRGYRV